MTKNYYPPNFSRKEMLRSNSAARLGIQNEPNSEEFEQNILQTAWYLQNLRDKLSERIGATMPITVYSCYRSPELNVAVGGSRTSAHMKGLAADIVVDGLTPLQLAKFIQSNCEFDQLIVEFNEWVHVGIPTDKSNRMKAMTATKRVVNGKKKTVYTDGI